MGNTDCKPNSLSRKCAQSRQEFASIEILVRAIKYFNLERDNLAAISALTRSESTVASGLYSVQWNCLLSNIIRTQ